MPPLQGHYVSIALSRLRRGVSFCCSLVVIALVAQMLVWCVATFMNVRHEVLQEKTAPPLIVESAPIAGAPTPTPRGSLHESGEASIGSPAPADLNRVSTAADRMMSKVSSFAMGVGTMSMAMLVPLLALGVLLGAGTATPGVDKTVSAFTWSLVVALLVLPIGQPLNLPWHEGALVSYKTMTSQVDLEMFDDPNRWGSFSFYARFAVLPLACVVGMAIVGLRFSAGVSAGITPKEDMRLDPVLEKEAANMSPSSLHSGRSAAALRAATTGTVAESKPKAKPAAVPTSAATITQLAAGETPKRLI